MSKTDGDKTNGDKTNGDKPKLTCPVCLDTRVDAIEDALAGGMKYKQAAAEYHISGAQLYHHVSRRDCIERTTARRGVAVVPGTEPSNGIPEPRAQARTAEADSPDLFESIPDPREHFGGNLEAAHEALAWRCLTKLFARGTLERMYTPHLAAMLNTTSGKLLEMRKALSPPKPVSDAERRQDVRERTAAFIVEMIAAGHTEEEALQALSEHTRTVAGLM